MRRIGVVTVARSDYSIYAPVLESIRRRPGLELSLIVSGMHLAPAYGLTVQDIESDGVPIVDRLEFLLSGDTPTAIGTSIGLGVVKFAESLARLRPDLLLVLGDRFEMLAAAVAALPHNIPIGHIHGGELTLGAIDDAIRHSITKLSHLHFTTNPVYARRIIQMGEEPWRVFCFGSPAVDSLLQSPKLSREYLGAQLGLELRDTLIVTFHPVTLDHEETSRQVSNLLEALEPFKNEILMTYPNADTSNHVILERLKEFVKGSPRRYLKANLGRKIYPSLLRHASAMVGNSSSGLIEAPTFQLPVVNIGRRQEGRVQAGNVINTGYGVAEIRKGLKKALKPAFRKGLEELLNPYGDGRASEQIVGVLSQDLAGDRRRLLTKCFQDISVPALAGAA